MTALPSQNGQTIDFGVIVSHHPPVEKLEMKNNVILLLNNMCTVNYIFTMLMINHTRVIVIITSCQVEGEASIIVMHISHADLHHTVHVLHT